ncbi:MAG: CvpA family protein [Clostridia bacterium]|nr:CvpA family protein [Clostridia bacterium]
MKLILDLIIALIVLFFVITSAKKGFVKVVVEAVGFIAAIILVFTISTPLAVATYDKIIEPAMVSAVEKNAEESAGETAEHEAWNAIPDFLIKNAQKLGISSEEFASVMEENMVEGSVAAVRAASQRVVRPVAIKILGLIYSIILIIVLLILVKLIAKIINGLFSFSIVGKANRALGAAVGFLKGVVFAVVFCMAVSLLVSLTKGGFLIFTQENIDSSYIFKAITQLTFKLI